MDEKYFLKKTEIEPKLYITLTDNWIEMTLRYVINISDRREVNGKLNYELLKHFEAEPAVTIASSTFEIVRFPPLKTNDKLGKS